MYRSLSPMKSIVLNKIYKIRDISFEKNYILYFIMIFILIACRKSSALFQSYFFAEGGTIFLQRALDDGVSSLLQPYAGYIHFIPQLITLVSIWLSKFLSDGIDLVPYFCNYAMLIFSTSIIFTFYSNKFEWLIYNKNCRIFICFAVVLLSKVSTTEVWHTIINFQWWSGIYIFLVGLNIFKYKELPKEKNILLFLLIIALSTPLGGLTVLLFATIIIYKVLIIKKTVFQLYKDFLIIMIVTIPICVQAYLFLFGSRSSNTDILIALYNTIKTVLAIIPSVLYPPILKVISAIVTLPHNLLQFIIITTGTIVWILTFYLIGKKLRWVAIYTLIFCSATLMLAYLSDTNNELYNNLFYEMGGGRYIFIPQACFLILFLIAIVNLINLKKYNVLIKSICFYFIIISFTNYNLPHNSEFSDLYQRNAWLYDKASSVRCNIAIDPPPAGNWGISLAIGLDNLDAYSYIPQHDIRSHINGKEIEPNEMVSASELELAPFIEFSGWAIDELNKSSPSSILINVNGNYIAPFLVKRDDVAAHFNNNSYTNTGYRIMVPKKYIISGRNICELIIISSTKEFYYKIPFFFTTEEFIL